MDKKGMTHGMIFVYVLATLVFSGVLIYGYGAFHTVSERRCIPYIHGFGDMLKNEVNRLDFMEGSLVRQEFKLGCGIDRVYLVDLEMDPETYFLGNDIINRSIQADAPKNVFLLRGDKIVQSFLIEGFEIEFPYYICTRTEAGTFRINFFSTGGAAVLRNGDPFLDCGLFDFMMDVSSKIYPDIASEVGASLLLQELKENVNFVDETRTFVTDGSGTEVTMTLRPSKNLEKIRHIEIISKCFSEHVDILDFEIPPTMILNDDPIVMWEFDNVVEGDEISLSYKVAEMIDELCRNWVKSLGGAVTDENIPMSYVLINQEKDLSEVLSTSQRKMRDDLIYRLADAQVQTISSPTISKTEDTQTYRELYMELFSLNRRISRLEKEYDSITRKQDLDDDVSEALEEDIEDLKEAYEQLKSEFESRVTG